MRPLASPDRRRPQRGQALVIAALAFTVLLAMTGVVIDSGNAYVQQRGTQNAADSAALAGATVMVENLGGSPKTDADVLAAVRAAISNNQTTLSSASYVDWTGANVGTVGNAPSGAIPSTAAGVNVKGERTFRTYVAGIAGFNNFTVGADATAVAGSLTGVCAADAGCGVLPVTMSVNISDCAGDGKIILGKNPWPLVDLATAQADQGIGKYEAIVPLCKVGPGGVGWLDMGCGGTLKQQISNPCNQAFNIPTWLQTSPGNPNSVDSEMNRYDGKVVLVPLFDGTCRSVPTSGLLPDCTNPGNGSNLYFHITTFAGFYLDHAYIQGSNKTECNSAPGITVTPPAGGNGGTSCLKGWFVRYVTVGPVGAFNPGSDNGNALGVQLIG